MVIILPFGQKTKTSFTRVVRDKATYNWPWVKIGLGKKMPTVFMVWPYALLIVIANANCKGNWCLCRVNGHFKRFVVVVMRGMLTIFPTCTPPMICATINLRAKRVMIRRVPLQSPEVASRFLSKIIGTPTLRARRCGGIPARVMVLRNYVPIAIAWSSPRLHQVCWQKYVLLPRHNLDNLSVERVHDYIFCCQNSSTVHVSLVCIIDC